MTALGKGVAMEQLDVDATLQDGTLVPGALSKIARLVSDGAGGKIWQPSEEAKALGPGSHASRPAATDVAPGTTYACTTHPTLIYISDGTTWSTWATISSGGSIVVKDEGSTLTSALAQVDFVGSGVTATNSGANVTVTIPGGSGISTVKDEGSNVETSAASLNFTGTGVTATSTAGAVTVSIPGGGTPGFVGVKAYRSAAYALLNNTDTPMPWDAEEYDTNTFHDPSTNNERFTIPSGLTGYYRLTANIGTDVPGTSTRWYIRFLKNGGAVRGGAIEHGFNSSGNYPMPTLTCDVFLTAGDFVQANYFQNSGSTRNFFNTQCAMSMVLLGT